MHVRRFLSGLATITVTVAGLALTSGAAHAAPEVTTDPDDVPWTTGTELIGTGSDTTQHVMALLARAYNAKSPAVKISTYAATNGTSACAPAADCQIVLPAPDGQITRPVGSGAGRNQLYSPNRVSVSFARASATMGTADFNAGLKQIPFALDYVVAVTSGNVQTNAPATLTGQQLADIYLCKTTADVWTEVGGTSPAAIVPYGPSASSGTGATFYAALAQYNGGATVVPGSCVQTAVENNPSPIKDNPNAIAPFSEGLAKLATAAGNKLTIQTNTIRALRALYNVVRGGADLNKPGIQEMFGSAGFICSPAAKPLIEEAGFKQLRAPAQGGECGAPTSTPTSNFAADAVDTTTGVTVTGASASSAKIVASVKGTTAPSGTVTFSENGAVVATNVPLVSGAATTTVPATPGTHTYKAVFTPASGSAFLGSEGTGTGSVQKGTSSIKADFPKKVKFGKKAKGTVTITVAGTSAKATGTVTIKEGNKVVGTGKLANGTVKITLKKLKPGKHKLTIEWPGDTNAGSSSAKVTIKALPKPKPKN